METIIGYRDEFHCRVNNNSFVVEFFYNDKQLSRGIKYPTLEEAVKAAETILAFNNARI